MRIEKAVALSVAGFNLAWTTGKVVYNTYIKPKLIRAHKATLVRGLIWTFLRKMLGRREQMKSVTTAKAVDVSAPFRMSMQKVQLTSSDPTNCFQHIYFPALTIYTDIPDLFQRSALCDEHNDDR